MLQQPGKPIKASHYSRSFWKPFNNLSRVNLDWVLSFTAERVSPELLLPQTLKFTHNVMVNGTAPSVAQREALGGYQMLLSMTPILLIERLPEGPHSSVLARVERINGLWKPPPSCNQCGGDVSTPKV